MTENKIYISTDHKTFCLKHRSHSVSYSCCPDCFEGIKEELSQAKDELDGSKTTIKYLQKAIKDLDELLLGAKKEIAELKNRKMIFSPIDTELTIVGLKKEAEEWKQWAEKFSEVSKSFRSCKRHAQGDGACVACLERFFEILSDFQKFKESQDPKRCKHDVWTSDYCYSCEKESKEK